MSARHARIRRVVVFDLDDTLYAERDYVMSGFAAVGRWAEVELGLADFAGHCRRAFVTGERRQVFDHALRAAGRDVDPKVVQAMVKVYRNHRPAISLAADAAQWLAAVPAGVGLALITDGFREAQSRKVAALGLAARGFDPILVTDHWGRDFWKPHPRAFETIERHFGLSGAALTYVADNSVKDFITPRALGWRTVQVCRTERLHTVMPPTPAHRADCAISSLSELDAALARDCESVEP